MIDASGGPYQDEGLQKHPIWLSPGLYLFIGNISRNAAAERSGLTRDATWCTVIQPRFSLPASDFSAAFPMRFQCHVPHVISSNCPYARYRVPNMVSMPRFQFDFGVPFAMWFQCVPYMISVSCSPVVCLPGDQTQNSLTHFTIYHFF